MAKLFAGDLAQKLLYDCMQLGDIFGYTTEFPINRMWTDSHLVSIGAGTSEIIKEILLKLENLYQTLSCYLNSR